MKKGPDLTKASKKLTDQERTISEIYFSNGSSHISCDDEYDFKNLAPAKASDWVKSHKTFSVHADEWYYENVFSVSAKEWYFESDLTIAYET